MTAKVGFDLEARVFICPRCRTKLKLEGKHGSLLPEAHGSVDCQSAAQALFEKLETERDEATRLLHDYYAAVRLSLCRIAARREFKAKRLLPFLATHPRPPG